jgi:MOSC domain-containing protein YiiM
MIKSHPLNGMYCGKVKQRYSMETAIDKLPVTTSLYLTPNGLTGDECADKEHHGGLERALHQYPAEHYAYWQKKYSTHVNNGIDWQAPGMGENISSVGMTEESVCLGDRYQWGEAVIEVSQPRSPCFKLNKRWGVENISVDMQSISRCGWLYRVITPGRVSVDNPLVLVARVDKAITIKALCEAYFGDPLNIEKLLMIRQQETLSDSWMDKVIERLATNKVEDWNFRLLGPA